MSTYTVLQRTTTILCFRILWDVGSSISKFNPPFLLSSRVLRVSRVRVYFASSFRITEFSRNLPYKSLQQYSNTQDNKLGSIISCISKRTAVGAVVRALAFHRCGPGSIPRLGVPWELSSLVLYFALRGFPVGTSVFFSHQKSTFALIWYVNLICNILN